MALVGLLLSVVRLRMLVTLDVRWKHVGRRRAGARVPISALVQGPPSMWLQHGDIELRICDERQRGRKVWHTHKLVSGRLWF
jgi:hypothetical protein